MTVSAIEVAGRRLDRKVRHVELWVDAHLTPDTRVPGVSPRIVVPRIVAKLVGCGNRVKDPLPLARSYVVAANVSLDVLHGNRHTAESMCRANDDRVTGNNWRGVQTNVGLDGVEHLVEVQSQVDNPLSPNAETMSPVAASSATSW